MAYSLENTKRISELPREVYDELINNTPALYNVALEYITDSANYQVSELLYGIPARVDYEIDPCGRSYVDFRRCDSYQVVEYLENIERNYGAITDLYYKADEFKTDIDNLKRYTSILEADNYGSEPIPETMRDNIEKSTGVILDMFGKKLAEYCAGYYEFTADEITEYSYDGEIFDDYYITPDGVIFEIKRLARTNHYKNV